MESSKIKSSDPDDFDIEVSYPVMYVSQLPEKILPLKFHDKQNQLILNKYPVYLKNTLYQPLHIKKLRSLDSMEKLIPFDDFKKQGNISFYKEEYEKAIEYYEHCYGIYKYLDVKLTDQLIKQEDIQIITANGKNPEEMLLINSAIVTILNNLACSYVKLRNFEDAMSSISEALIIKPKDPNLLSKRAKIRLCNLKDENFKEALADIDKAIVINKNYEKLKEKYTEITDFRTKLTDEIVLEIADSYTKCSFDINSEISQEKEFEHKIVKKMEEKYYEMISFYMENNKPANLARIREEMKVLQLTLYKMEFAFNLSLSNELLKKSIQEKYVNQVAINPSVLDTVKRTYISIIFTEGKFNEQLLGYCMEKCTEEEKLKNKNLRMDNKSYFTCFNMCIVILIIGMIMAFSI